MLAKGCNSISCFTCVCCHDRVSEERAIGYVYSCGWLAGGHQAEKGALLKTNCFAAMSGGCVDTPSWLVVVFLNGCRQWNMLNVLQLKRYVFVFYTSLCVPAHLNHIQVCKSSSDRRNIVVSLSTFIPSDSGMFNSKSTEKQTCAKIHIKRTLKILNEMLQLITNKSAFS